MKHRSHQGRKALYGSLLAGGLASTALVPQASWAQTVEATLRGKAPANAEVVARNVETGATRRTKATAEGTYTLPGLIAGTYRVSADGKNEQVVTLAVASISNLDLTQAGTEIAADATLEEVIIRATRLVEVKTSEVGQTVSLRTIEVTPQVTRNFLEFADTVPGMVFSIDSNGNTSIQSGAQANSSINVYIDGVGQKNYIKPGGISGQAGPNGNGDPGNPFPQLAIGEYKVITSNYKAEFDQITSAAITAQTKSGTNQFHGEAFGDFTSDKLRSATPSENAAGGKKLDSQIKEYGVAAGGPIIQDHLHYFVDWEHKSFNLPNTVTVPGSLAGISNLGSLLPPGVFSQFGPTTNPFTENLYFGKLDFEPSDADRIELSIKLRREVEVQGGSGITAASAAFNFKNDDTRGVLKWQHNADHWQNEAMLTTEKTVDNPTPLNSNPAITYTWVGAPLANGSDTADIINVNGQDPRQYTDKHQKGTGFQDDFTLHDLHWHGDHTLKMGVKYKQVQLVARDGSDAAKFWYAVDAVNGTAATPYQVVYGKVNSGLPLSATSDNKQFGIYFQDDWAVNEHLTFNLGLRWDYEITPSFTDYKTPASILAALNSPYPDPGVNANPTLQLPRPTPGETYAQALALGGTNIADYTSTGNNRNPQSNEWQPRLGFSYDLGANERHVIFGGIGRSYDRNLFDRLQLENSKNALSEPTIKFPGGNYSPQGSCLTAGQINGTDCVAWNNAYLTNPSGLQALGGGVGEVDMFPNKLKAPYSDQFSIGMRNKLGDWNTSATVVHLRSYDGLMGVLGNRFANGQFATRACGLDWGGSPAQWCSSGAPGIGSLILWENGQNTRTTQILLNAEKPYTAESGWATSISYTFTDAVQNRLYNDGYAFDLPHLSNYPYTTSNAVAKHRLVVTGNIDGPWGFVFGGKLTLASPIPVTAIAGCPVNGTSCNPYGTNAWPVAVGFDQTIGYRSLDLQVTKNFEVSHGMSLYGRLDLLNAFNAKNYDSNSAIWSASTTSSTPAKYNTTGPIVGVPQTLKLTIGMKW